MWRLMFVFIVPSICRAQVADCWVDLGRGLKPAYTVGLILPEIKVWDFLEPDHPAREIGQLWPVEIGRRSSLLVGAYLSNWSKTDDWFIEPYCVFDHQFSDCWRFNGQLGIYAPLTDRDWAVFSSESRLTFQLNEETEIGLAGSAWKQEGASCAPSWGPIIRQKIDQFTLAIRWLSFGGGQETGRIELIAPLKF